MAKIITSGLQLLQHLPANIVIVNSKTYGLHIRMKRGTHKKAKLNKAFQQNNSKTTVIAQTAKGIHEALNIVCRTFKQKDLWQVMMRRMFNASETSPSALIDSLQGLEINAAFPLIKLVKKPVIKVSKKGQKWFAAWQASSHPAFMSSIERDSYYYGLTAIWLGDGCQQYELETIDTEWIYFSDNIPAFGIFFTTPAWAKHYLLLLKVQAGNNNCTLDHPGTTAMQVVATGSLSRTS